MRHARSRAIQALAALLLATPLCACGKPDSHPKRTDSDTGPTATALLISKPELLPAGNAVPLTRVLAVDTNRPVRVDATVESATESHTWRFAESGLSHRIPLIGFKPGQDWRVVVTLVEPDGTAHAQDPLSATPSELPSIFPDFDVTTLDVARTQPGYTLLNLRSSGSPAQPNETWTLLDETLTPAWVSLHEAESKMVFQASDGTFLGLDKRPAFEGQYAVRRDLMGEVLDEWHTDESWDGAGFHLPGTFALHHDMIELPNGNFAALLKEADGFAVDNFPVDYADPYVRQDGLFVNADRIVEFTPAGAVVANLGLAPLLDAARIGYDSLDSSFLDGRIDWTHANGLAYDPLSDAYLISFRHQDAVVKLDRTSGHLVWILGTPANWSPLFTDLLLTPDASVAWPYHQHSPNIAPDGRRLLVFDNGNWGGSPWQGAPPVNGPSEIRSRIVEFEVDEAGGTVRQNWDFAPAALSCPAVGGASYLDNGNVLATFGVTVAIDGVMLAQLGLGDEAVRIVEIDPSDSQAIVGDVWISSARANFIDGWQAFTSHRIASPYPEGYLLD